MTFKKNDYGRYISNIDNRFYVRKHRTGSYEVYYCPEYIGHSSRLIDIKSRFMDMNKEGLTMFFGNFMIDKVNTKDLGRFGYDFTYYNCYK